MSQPSREEVAGALSWISPDDRDVWVRMAMACRSALGDDGWALWDEWSEGSESYRPRDAASVWRSVRPQGGVTAGSLFELARRAGWRPNARGRFRPRRPIRSAPPPMIPGPSREEAAWRAGKMIAEARYDVHPYLTRKGFPGRKMLVLGETLLVPMRPIGDYQRIASVQMIRPDGGKRFLKGGRASGCVYHLGLGSSEQWWCEGLATGLSILAALRLLCRRARVTVCFSASNLSKVARGRGIVVADRDEESRTGENAARQTGLRYWLPPDPGDANDFHRARGARALAEELRKILNERSPGPIPLMEDSAA